MDEWKFVEHQRKHTQDGVNLALLMKSIGRGLRKVCAVDIGCGDGIISSEMFKHRRASEVVAIDILKPAVVAASFNLRQQIADGTCLVKCMSAQRFFNLKSNYDTFNTMVINPPYFSKGSGFVHKNQNDRIARHDSKLNVLTWSRGAAKILKVGGELYCVFPTERLSEAFTALSRQGVEPKELWWLKADFRKRRFFLRAVKGGRPGLKIHFDFEIKNYR
jgi:tRNA1Val (adenine37-N6)-methyltransferase